MILELLIKAEEDRFLEPAIETAEIDV